MITRHCASGLRAVFFAAIVAGGAAGCDMARTMQTYLNPFYDPVKELDQLLTDSGIVERSCQQVQSGAMQIRGDLATLRMFGAGFQVTVPAVGWRYHLKDGAGDWHLRLDHSRRDGLASLEGVEVVLERGGATDAATRREAATLAIEQLFGQARRTWRITERQPREVRRINGREFVVARCAAIDLATTQPVHLTVYAINYQSPLFWKKRDRYGVWMAILQTADGAADPDGLLARLMTIPERLVFLPAGHSGSTYPDLLEDVNSPMLEDVERSAR